MKQINNCPISESKCEFKKAGVGCTKHINPNECGTSIRFRKRQSKTSKKNIEHYQQYWY